MCETVEKHQKDLIIIIGNLGINNENQSYKEIIYIYLIDFDWGKFLVNRVGEN